MKFSITTDDELDVLWSSIEHDKIPAPSKRRWFAPSTILQYVSHLWKKMVGLLYDELPRNLYSLTLGTYLKVTQEATASSIIQMISEEFHITVPQHLKISVLNEWMTQIQQINKMFEKAQPTVSHEGYQQAIWQQVSDRHKVSPSLWLLDHVSRRFGITYDKAMELSVSDILTALQIDAVNQEYESRMMDWQKQQSRKK